MHRNVPLSYLTADGKPGLATRVVGESVTWLAVIVCSPWVLRERFRRRREQRTGRGPALRRSIRAALATLAVTVRDAHLRGADRLRLTLVVD